jgi:hypothetical protein
MSTLDETYEDPELPPVDARLIYPGTRYEVYDGILVYVPPADERRATRLSKVGALLALHVAPEFDAALRMLTRTSETSDVAPDVSVFPHARDPTTEGRFIEQLAFEVVSIDSLSYAERKARMLTTRGVRRIFAIDVLHERVQEWCPHQETWTVLDPVTTIQDPALAVSLPIKALIDPDRIDDFLARALLIKRNPVVEAYRMARAAGLTHDQARLEAVGPGRDKWLERAWAEPPTSEPDAVFARLAERDVVLQDIDRAQILDERDPARLYRWLVRASFCTDVAEVLAEP